MLTQTVLNRDSLHGFYLAQEALDDQVNSITLDAADTKFDTKSRVIKNVATPVAANDAAPKTYVDTAISNQMTTANLGDVRGPVVAVSEDIAIFSGTTGKVISDSATPAWQAASGGGTSVDITTTESDAGFSVGGVVVKVRRVSGTSPAYGTNQGLFTPSTGAASRLLDVRGWIIRSGTGQRHQIMSVEAGSDHASMIYQIDSTGAVFIWSGLTAYASQLYDALIYYTL